MFPGRFTAAEKREMSYNKEKAYQEAFLQELKLITGLDRLLADAHRLGIRMAIGSAAIMFNIDFVLDNLSIRPYFQVLISADDVTRSKPDPETYLRCAEALAIDPTQCLVFVDAPKGVESAARAGIDALVIVGGHAAEEFAGFGNIIHMAPDFRNIDLP
jgi:HAD superfamily hydrolase (TIGR01509 family)